MSSKRSTFLRLLGIAFAAFVPQTLPASGPDLQPFDLESDFRPYLETYCVDCHGPDKQKGDRRMDTLEFPIQDSATLIALQDILDIVNMGEMPPPEEDLQPKRSETQRIVDQLTHTIEDRHALLQSTGQETVFRRLNSREYRNTLRDLLAMDLSLFDPTESFPRDETEAHLDTIGDKLVTSGYLLDRYIEAADQTIEKVFELQERPPQKSYRFTDNFKQQPELDGSLKDWAKYEFMTLYETPNSQRHEGAYAKIHDFEDGVPHDGYYRIRAQAIAKHRRHDHPPQRVSTNPDEPLLLGIVPGNKRFGELSRPQPIEPQLAEFALQDETLQWYEATVWLDAGFTPRFTFPNGMLGFRGNFRPVSEAINKQFNGNLKNEDFADRRLITMQYGKLPHIQIHDVEIVGPLYESWPPPSQKTLLQGKRFSPNRTRNLITNFASKAYRRPASKGEVNQLMHFVKQRKAEGSSPFQAYKDALKRVLCSPAFLFLEEPSDDQERLSSYALASRLSYFLWSSMPDKPLLALASKGQLERPAILERQIKRMLADPKSEAFLESFVDSCLTLKDLGTQPPDRKAFQAYYARNLQGHMRQETLLFAKDLLERNQPIDRFIDADYTFINGALAELYGYPGIQGPEFRKIDIPDRRRSGILGHASILTVTANGIDTSPVTRGVWMLENILGSPPSPPPPDVEPFDPDTRGAISMRQQLEKHRENPTCYECHRKIDPIGFAFESFDAIGRWRNNYKKGGPIDSSGALPDGTEFSDITELKEALLTRSPQMARALTEKLLAYATGRRMEPGDRRAIEGIVEDLEARGNGFQDLIQLIIQSDPFQKI